MTENVEALKAERDQLITKLAALTTAPPDEHDYLFDPTCGSCQKKRAALAERTTIDGCLDTKCPATALVGIHRHPAERTTTTPADEMDAEAVLAVHRRHLLDGNPAPVSTCVWCDAWRESLAKASGVAPLIPSTSSDEQSRKAAALAVEVLDWGGEHGGDDPSNWEIANAVIDAYLIHSSRVAPIAPAENDLLAQIRELARRNPSKAAKMGLDSLLARHDVARAERITAPVEQKLCPDRDCPAAVFGNAPSEHSHAAPVSSREQVEAAEHIERLRVAMLGTTDGDFIDSDTEVPAGEMFRLAAGYVEFAALPPAAPKVTAEQMARTIWDAAESFSEREPYPYEYLLERVANGEGDYAEIHKMLLAEATAVLALLQQGGEDKWQYRAVAAEPDTGDIYDSTRACATATEATEYAERVELLTSSPDLPHLVLRLQRRRPAGPWELAPEQGRKEKPAKRLVNVSGGESDDYMGPLGGAL